MERITRQVNHGIILPTRKRVAAYARVSSNKEEMIHSLSAQVDYYKKYIKKNRQWEYAGIYVDEGITGTKSERPEFQKMIEDCRMGKIDMIITKSISRFARNTLVLLKIVRELKELGINVFFEKDNINTLSGDGEMMLTILASFSQAESLSVSENCKWRIRKGFRDGELMNFRFMYGYRITKGNVEIEEEEAEIVRMIFNDYINGMGGGQIAKKLVKMGVEKLRGGVWKSERVLDILKNEKYTGNATLQKKYVKDHLTKSLVRNKGELPLYKLEETHPAIIDMETFNKAQDIRKANIKKFGGKKEMETYLFTSKIVCGECGKKYRHKTRDGREFWQCQTKLEFGNKECKARAVPNEEIIKILKKVLKQDIIDKEIIDMEIIEIRVPKQFILEIVLRDGRKIKEKWKYDRK